MALNIEGATIGFDATQVKTFLANVKQNTIDDMIEKLNFHSEELMTKVDDAWQGAAADHFKLSFDADKQAIIQALNESYDVFCSELYQIVDRMKEVDADLVEIRGEMG